MSIQKCICQKEFEVIEYRYYRSDGATIPQSVKVVFCPFCRRKLSTDSQNSLYICRDGIYDEAPEM